MTRDTWQGDDNTPMSYNAWLYTFANPINFVNPSGRIPCEFLPPYDQDFCTNDPNPPDLSSLKVRMFVMYGLRLTSENTSGKLDPGIENWEENSLMLIEQTANILSNRLLASVNWETVYNQTGFKGRIIANELFKTLFGGLEIRRGDENIEYVPNYGRIYGKIVSKSLYRIYGPKDMWLPGSIRGKGIILHELGHIMDQRSYLGNQVTLDFQKAINDPCTGLKSLVDYIREREQNGTGDFGIKTDSGLGVNFRSDITDDEIVADLFASWALDSFYSTGHNDGKIFKNYATSYMGFQSTKYAIIWSRQHGYRGLP